MMKKFLKTIVAFSLGLSMMIGANVDGVYAKEQGDYYHLTNADGEYIRGYFNGEEVYFCMADGENYVYKDSSDNDWGRFYCLILYDFNHNYIGSVSNGYIYGIDGNSIVDGAVIYGDVEYDNGTTSYLPGNVNSYDPSNREKRPNATLEKYDFNEMVIYDWYSMGNYLRKE